MIEAFINTLGSTSIPLLAGEVAGVFLCFAAQRSWLCLSVTTVEITNDRMDSRRARRSPDFIQN